MTYQLIKCETIKLQFILNISKVQIFMPLKSST